MLWLPQVVDRFAHISAIRGAGARRPWIRDSPRRPCRMPRLVDAAPADHVSSMSTCGVEQFFISLVLFRGRRGHDEEDQRR